MIAPPTAPVDKLVESFREKILRKCGESIEMKERFFTKYAEPLEAMSRALAVHFEKGGRLFAMGNGGSLCDALHITVEFNHPIIEKRAAFPVIPLMTDTATMTAIGNDLDFSRVFVNQLRSAAPGDVAMAFSTSGKSPNLIYALEAARELQMLTVAFAGKDGGRFPDVADYCLLCRPTAFIAFRRSTRRSCTSCGTWFTSRLGPKMSLETASEPLTGDANDLGATCPTPLSDYKEVVLAHGSGGKLSQRLLQSVVLPRFQNELLAPLHDGAIFDLDGSRIAFSTDSYVVSPIFFPEETSGNWRCTER